LLKAPRINSLSFHVVLECPSLAVFLKFVDPNLGRGGVENAHKCQFDMDRLKSMFDELAEQPQHTRCSFFAVLSNVEDITQNWVFRFGSILKDDVNKTNEQEKNQIATQTAKRVEQDIIDVGDPKGDVSEQT
jgi:hypothetical protein